ncbi:hypothetical protein [Streptomyces rubradiris]|uniref:Uncharacterized protein n=1 Tax=Streptomyces rubradiris TaxID=285531 RepID=A0ABQ3R3L8_STRRR|nr:hypothetical protein [Streptomyces rubradiris]GHH30085.1 hypothetical protein GCM10018792_76060 [Streptomyces rubradiris]GHI50387.1 hypothetical protein Srubr_02330 [Streptomyces rubradiris]
MTATDPITIACLEWIRRATPDQRREYLATGSRGAGLPIDTRPAAFRTRDLARALRGR